MPKIKKLFVAKNYLFQTIFINNESLFGANKANDNKGIDIYKVKI